MSKAALAFDRKTNRSLADLEVFFQQAPKDAGAWLSNVAHAAGVDGRSLSPLDKAVRAGDTVARMAQSASSHRWRKARVAADGAELWAATDGAEHEQPQMAQRLE